MEDGRCQDDLGSNQTIKPKPRKQIQCLTIPKQQNDIVREQQWIEWEKLRGKREANASFVLCDTWRKSGIDSWAIVNVH